MTTFSAANQSATATAGGDDDCGSLARFKATGDEEALRRLIERHLPRVYTTARRFVRDPQLADDVAQAVFILLARKARSLRADTVVGAWLHRVTFLCSRTALRRERRRRAYELRAAHMKSDINSRSESAANPQDKPEGDELLCKLDVALAELGDTDRSAIVLRYLRAKPFAEVAAALGVTEAAATKRVTRALAKLRGLLRRRGVGVDDATLSKLLSVSPAPLPDGALAHATATAALAATKGVLVTGGAAAVAKGVIAASKAKVITAAAAAAVVVGATTAVVSWKIAGRPKPPALPSPRVMLAAAVAVAPANPEPRAPMPPKAPFDAVAPDDPELAAFPYAPGWPRALPGAIVGTPVVADLEGDGHLSVIVPCVHRTTLPGGAAMTSAHPQPTDTPLLFAFNADGSTVAGWPIALGGARPNTNASSWSNSPSIFRTPSGRDAIVAAGPGKGIVVINGDRTVAPNTKVGDAVPNIPVVDLNGDGVPDMVSGKLVASVYGQPLASWPAARRFRNGYAPCVGDAARDGQLRLYHLFYTNKGTDSADLTGFDARGNALPGWPRLIDDPSWLAPVMGDVAGDNKMEVIAAYGRHVFAWTCDGDPLPNTTTEGQWVGILRTNVFAFTASPALADLDGDGKAEIIVFDLNSHTIRAWHGDGRAVGGENQPPPSTNPIGPWSTARRLVGNLPDDEQGIDGVIAHIPQDAHGVSVVSLGDDPRTFDFFTGTYWVRWSPARGGAPVIKNMTVDGANVEWTQPTVTDLDGDGKADVTFGLGDGRLFVYQTGLAYHPERMQWPTANGNFQHTGCWQRPR